MEGRWSSNWMGHLLTCHSVPVQVVEHVAQAQDGSGCPPPSAQAGGFGLRRARALGSGCAARGAGDAGESGRDPSHAAGQRLYLFVGGHDSSAPNTPSPAASATSSPWLRPPAPAPPLGVRLLLLRAARRRRGAFQAHHAGPDRGGGGRGGLGGREAQPGPAQCVRAPRSRRCTIPARPVGFCARAPALAAPLLLFSETRGPGGSDSCGRPHPPGSCPITSGLEPQLRPARAAPEGAGEPAAEPHPPDGGASHAGALRPRNPRGSGSDCGKLQYRLRFR